MLRLDSMHRLLRRASAGGATRLSATRWEWDVSGNCTAPATREYHSRRDTFDGTSRGLPQITAPMPATIILHVRCRKCLRCLAKRAAAWRIRARYEILCAPRTWFVTLTWKPEEHYRLLLQAKRKASRGGVVLDTLTETERFHALADQAGADVTKWLKRMRKSIQPTKLRYLLVVEAHKSGLPHFHALVHEMSDGSVTHRLLTSQWPHGFSTAKLVENLDAAGYVAKYLTKSCDARVRASSRYGQQQRTHVLHSEVERSETNVLVKEPATPKRNQKPNEWS